MNNFDKALRDSVRRKLRKINKSDIVVGIPTYNSQDTISRVIETVAEGLNKYYPNAKAAIIISDGGSLDYTREKARKVKIPYQSIEKIVMIYHGIAGKGSAIRAIFEAAQMLDTRVCAFFDSDLQSITPEWVKSLVEPVLSGQYDFVAPYYIRSKYDATITNNISYFLIRALYGKRIRQPIGGDFGCSKKLVDYWNRDVFSKRGVWNSDIARFGIDIWMTTIALNEGFNVCQAYLGTKIHKAKDPATMLGSMFRQVTSTIFSMMPYYEHIWKSVVKSQPVPLVGEPHLEEVPSGEIDQNTLMLAYKTGFEHFKSLWQEIVNPECLETLKSMYEQPLHNIYLPIERWAEIVYDFAYTYLSWTRNRYKLLQIMTPLYYGRVVSFINEARHLSIEQTEEMIDKQAEIFEAKKTYLLQKFEKWDKVGLDTGES